MKKIIEAYAQSKGRYGSPKITKQLNNGGMKVSQKRVARRMKLLGFKSITVKNIIMQEIQKQIMLRNIKIFWNKTFMLKKQVKNGLEVLLIFILKKPVGLIQQQ